MTKPSSEICLLVTCEGRTACDVRGDAGPPGVVVRAQFDPSTVEFSAGVTVQVYR
jgi:hypothetical protein